MEPLDSMSIADVSNSLGLKEFLSMFAIGSQRFFIYHQTLDEQDDTQGCISVEHVISLYIFW